MAIIDPEGLFSGERLAACSDLAQFCWPRFFLAANSCGRIELSYKSLVSRVFGNFQEPPKSDELWAIFREYENTFLAILYESESGVWWCQFITSEKFLPKYKKTRDEQSPAPSFEMIEKHRRGYFEWKRSKSFKNQSFHKLPTLFSSEGIGIGVGGGIGEGEVKAKEHIAQDDKKLRPTLVDDSGVFDLPLADKSEYKVPEILFNEYVCTYPGVMVMEEFAKMRTWLLSNRKNMKTRNGMPRFMNSWLDRAQNDSSKRNGGNNAAVSNGKGQKVVGVLQNVVNRRQREHPAGEDGNLSTSVAVGRDDSRTIHASFDRPRSAGLPSGDEEPLIF